MTLNVQLSGNAMQMAIIQLAPGQTVYSEAGKFLFSSADVQMETKLSAPSASAGTGGSPQGSGGLGGMFGGGAGGGGAGGRVRSVEYCAVQLTPASA